MKPEAGLVIDSRFRLLSLVGVGAFGSLWRAADRIPGKQVAIRIIGDPKLDAQALDAFRREMIMASAVRHRSLARIEGAGWDAHGGVWVAREIVDGDSLESVLEREPPSAVHALTMISELADALSEVHALGLAHGAVSTRTVLLPRSKSGVTRPVLVGLGRARLLRSTQPAYSSAETLASQQYVAASDVWSLGVLLFRCVTGRLPFAARTAAAMEVETRRLNRLLSNIEDAGIRLLVADCFATDPIERPSASEVAHRARRLARELERQPHAPPTSESPPESEEESIESLAPAAMSVPPPRPTLPPSDVSAPSPRVSAPPPLPKRPAPVVASPEPPPVVAPSPEPPPAVVPPAERPPVPDNDNDTDLEVDFRPSRPRAKLVMGVLAAVAIFVELIIATHEPKQPPPVAAAAHIELEPVKAPEPPPPVASASEVAAAVSTTPPPAASSAVPSVAASEINPKAAPPPPTKAAPRAAKNPEDENPYE